VVPRSIPIAGLVGVSFIQIFSLNLLGLEVSPFYSDRPSLTSEAS